jgi:hypothetical protein
MGQHHSRQQEVLTAPVEVRIVRSEKDNKLYIMEDTLPPLQPSLRSAASHRSLHTSKIKRSLRRTRSSATSLTCNGPMGYDGTHLIPCMPNDVSNIRRYDVDPHRLHSVGGSAESIPPSYAPNGYPSTVPIVSAGASLAKIADRRDMRAAVGCGACSNPPASTPADKESVLMEAAFYAAYPEYASTLPLDLLRAAEFGRLRRGEAYVDAMGGALYPELLIRSHTSMLENSVFGNTHSQSARYAFLAMLIRYFLLMRLICSSQLSSAYATEARAAVLAHFNAPQGSKVIFTANASQALKLVGESFPFGSGYVFVFWSCNRSQRPARLRPGLPCVHVG